MVIDFSLPAELEAHDPPEAVTPGFLRLLAERMPSGRYRAADLMPARA